MMNIHRYILGIVAWSTLLLSAGVQAQEAPERGGALLWKYTDVDFERIPGEGTGLDRLRVTMSVLPTADLASSEWIEITPIVRSRKTGEQVTFPSLYVAGKGRYLQMRRLSVLGNELPHGVPLDEVFRLSDLKREPLRKEMEIIPFEYWMADAELIIREQVYGCASCGVRSASGAAGESDLFVFGPEHFVYDYLEPAAVAQKSYEESFVSRVTFVVARHELKPDFDNNRQELRRIRDFIDESLKVSELGATLGEVRIEGYASPEGEFYYNKALSERRSRTLADYVVASYPTLSLRTKLSVEGGGEDWVGLREAVAKSDKPYAQAVVAIIDRYDTDTERERDIKSLEGGAVYRELLSELYPPLRRSVIRMRYDVRPYEVAELPAIYDKNPALMSHLELCMLADVHYRQKGKNPVEVYRIAYERYGADPISRLNYATALLEYEPQRAEEVPGLVAPLGADKRATYLRACAYQLMGQQAKAEELYRASRP